MVFSSSCTVYGNPEKVPIDEGHPLKALSPYGRTKLIIEDMFRDVAAAEKEWRTILLRYFNPVGAHPSGAPARPPGPTGAARRTCSRIMLALQAGALLQSPVVTPATAQISFARYTHAPPCQTGASLMPCCFTHGSDKCVYDTCQNAPSTHDS